MANSGIVGILRVLLGLDTAEFESGVKKAKGQAKSFEDQLKSFSKGFAGEFLPVAGVAAAGIALAAFTKKAFDTASQIADLSDQTGLTTESIQEMQAAATLTGTSLESFTNAAFKLGVNLADGTDKVRNAVDALGLSYEMLRDQSPDAQFKTIAMALGQLEDVQLRNKIAVDLFGRGAKEILPAVAQGYDQIAASASKAGEAQIRALDEAGDAMSAFWNGTKSLATEVLGQLVINFRDTFAFLSKAPREALASWSAVFEGLGLKSAELPKVMDQARVAASLLPPALKTVTMSLEEQKRVEKELTKSAEEKGRATVKAFDDAAAAAERFKSSVLYFNTADFTNGFISMVEPLRVSADEFARLESNVHPATQALEGFKAAAEEVRTKVGQLGQALKEGLVDVLKNVPQTMANAFTGGGNFEGALKSIASQIGSMIGGSIGFFIGGPIGQNIGRAIGSLAGKLVDGFKKLFGIGRDEAEEFRKVLAKQGLSFQELERRAKEVGMTFVDVWHNKGAKGAAALKARIDEVNRAIEEQRRLLEEQRRELEGQIAESRSALDGLIGDADRMGYRFNKAGELIGYNFEQVEQRAKGLGIRLESLGSAFQHSRIQTSAKELVNTLDLLFRAGGDVGGILFDLKDKFSALVNDAKKHGTTLPAQMQPWINELLRAGLLVDQNGQKLESLEGINFGDPIESEFEGIQRAIRDTVQKINEMISRIGELVNSIMGIPNRTVDIVERITTDDQRRPGSVVGPSEGDWTTMPVAASGGFVTRTGAALVHAGEVIGPLESIAPLISAALASMSSLLMPIGLSPALSGAGAQGGITNYNHFELHFEGVLDEGSLEQTTQQKLIPMITRAVSNNTGKARTNFRDALEIDG